MTKLDLADLADIRQSLRHTYRVLPSCEG